MLSGSSDAKELVAWARGGVSTFELCLRVMAAVTAVGEARGIRPIVVGGHAVAIYTRGDYATRAIDLVAPDAIAEALSALGFSRQLGERHWYQPELQVAIEVASRNLAGSFERVVKIRLDGGGHIYVIGVEDLIRDRMRACAYWASTVDCEWAERLFAVHSHDLDLPYIFAAMAPEPRDGYQKMRPLIKEWVRLYRS